MDDGRRTTDNRQETTDNGHIVPMVFVAVCVLFYMCGVHLQRDEAMIEKSMFLYQFCHVSIWHLLGNMAALYSIESSAFRTSWQSWLAAYIISAIFPCYTATEGISGLLYAMMGIISWQAADTKKFHLWCAFFIGVCFLFPNAVNGWIHVWCYLSGVMYGMILISFRIWKRCGI